MRAFVSDFVALVANEDLGDVALLRELDSFFVGEFDKSPEGTAPAGGSTVMKPIGASLLLLVADGKPGLTAQSVDALLNEGFRLV